MEVLFVNACSFKVFKFKVESRYSLTLGPLSTSDFFQIYNRRNENISLNCTENAAFYRWSPCPLLLMRWCLIYN